MVERQGSDSTMSIEHLDRRVAHLEESVDGLHKDSVRTQGALSGIAAKVDSLAITMQDIGEKLDQQRTRRPELGSMATLALVIITIGAMALAPMTWNVSRLENEINLIQHTATERAELVGRIQANREYVADRLAALEEAQKNTSSNRFTKADGQRLEDRLFDHARSRYHQPQTPRDNGNE